MLLPVEFPKKEHHDVRSGLFFFAIEPGRENLSVVEDEGVTLSEIIYDVLEQTVLDFSGFLVEDHEFALIPPSGRLGRDALLWKVEFEL